MAFYQALIPPPDAGGLREEIEQACLLPESFTWPALIFGGVWLLFKRLWLVFIVYALVWAGLIYLQRQMGFSFLAVMLSHTALAIFLGLEGQNLIARKLLRKGWRLVDVVEAPDLSSAERRFFERALPAGAPPRVAEAAPPPVRFAQSSAPVIGLFPEANGR
ncbi:DUF2628 domain-containing protein [Bosea vestrisii]|uniref:DUF2628 domain-containing protein n=1 Tax=Bosea vestrisii TaxID=151416 RepID=UPI0024E01D8F|nr:DUF2628 domain-containing protein [Bosea vestrisii]WID94411.1 DUF2628 domain-containing protein [Bosea vestrisii]